MGKCDNSRLKEINGNNYQLLTEPAAPGAAAKRAMKAEAKRRGDGGGRAEGAGEEAGRREGG